MKIIREAKHHEQTCHLLRFDYEGERGHGYSFDCDAGGGVDESQLKGQALLNYRACLSGEIDGRPVVNRGVDTFQQQWREPRVGLCNCGSEVELDGFTNTCEGCGKDYNWAGQQLAPRECWGEETGEHPADIGNIQ